jgi:tRNA threonylcarbamoyl adenosine modification protein YeaZ
VLLLALDTSTPAVTVALHDGRSVLAESTVVDPRRHGELLAPGVADVLALAGGAPMDLTDVVVGVGPGPFTGLRVGVATAVALGIALDIPVHGLCSLDALAWRAPVDGPFVVVTDARRREVYWAEYPDRASRQGDAGVIAPALLWSRAGGRALVGPGAGLVVSAAPDGSDAASCVADEAPLSAAAMAELAVARLAVGGELLEPYPLYLRRPDATAPGPRKRVLA